MELSDLFVGYNQVEPVHFNYETPVMPNYLYRNLGRAQQAATTQPPLRSEPIPEEAVPAEDMSSWRVASPYQDSQPTETPTARPAQSGSTGTSRSQSSPTKAEVNTASTRKTSPVFNMKMDDRALYWMGKFKNLGCSPAHQMAIVSAMYGECGLHPQGAVERKELAGKGNTKKGWAHAGEGAVGFTHWSLKRNIIAKYNADPRRKGPKLSTDEAVYSKPDSRHIVDLDDDDHALMAYLFYEDLIKRTQNANFEDIVAEFYLQKAGRGFGGRTGTSYDKAMRTARVYQASHAKLGYHAASKVNTFLKQLNFATRLSKLASNHI